MKKYITDVTLQPILFTREQYKELLRAIGAYTLIKQSAVTPYIDITGLGEYITEQGKKFNFERTKISEEGWFSEINDEVFQALFQYTQDEMWENLAHVLACRDAKAEVKEKTGLRDKNMPTDMFFNIMGRKAQMYLKEFEKNGIKNISVTCKDLPVSVYDPEDIG